MSRAPSVRVTARHMVDAMAGGTRVTLSIHYQGLLSALLARCVGDLNARNLTMEANGLMARYVGVAASHT